MQKIDLDFPMLIDSFMGSIGSNEVEIYNEFSFQHELGIELRTKLPSGWKVQFERNTSFFDILSSACLKKEIDIVVYDPEKQHKIALELKYPTNGQFPEQMFKFCQDICFLEQLIGNGFTAGYFLIVVDNHKFYEGEIPSPIYRFFRRGIPIHGTIQKPTGDKDSSVSIKGNYIVDWKPIKQDTKYALIEIK